jgi:hypothetical protein
VAQQWQVEHGDAARAIGRLVMQAKQSKRRSYAAFNTAHVQLVKAWQLASPSAPYQDWSRRLATPAMSDGVDV